MADVIAAVAGSDTAKVRRSVLALYGLPALALAIPTIPVYVYLPTFYAETLGLGLAVTGTIMLLARLFDMVTDPLIGWASDRFHFRWGRRKPWIAAGALLAGGGLLALFLPPPSVTAAYLLLAAMVLYLGWTMVSIPYTAWGAELSADYHERARITGFREGAMIVGVLVAGALPATAAALGGTERDGFVLVAILAIAVGAPSVYALLRWVDDPGDRGAAAAATTVVAKPATGASRLAEYRAILANKPFVRLLSAWFINGLANGFPSVLFPLYLEHALGADATERGVLIVVYFLAGVASIPLWLALSRRFGKHRTWCWAMLLACAAFVWVPFLQAGSIAVFFAICVLTGMALGADLALPPAMQADVLDLDRLRTGQRRAGLFFALWSMGTKLALAAAVGIAFPALELFGFETGQSNSEGAILALVVIYAAVPVVLKLLAIGLVWWHPLTPGRHAVIRRRLNQLENHARI